MRKSLKNTGYRLRPIIPCSFTDLRQCGFRYDGGARRFGGGCSDRGLRGNPRAFSASQFMIKSKASGSCVLLEPPKADHAHGKKRGAGSMAGNFAGTVPGIIIPVFLVPKGLHIAGYLDGPCSHGPDLPGNGGALH